MTLAELLTGVESFARRFVVMRPAESCLYALWVAHTHALVAADATPYLDVSSPAPRSGKTRLLEVSRELVASPWLTGRTTPAAISRKVDAKQPTLLLDETDASFNGDREYAETVRGILDSGYRRSGRSTVCLVRGNTVEVVDLS